MPSRCRSRIRARSNSANAPMTESIRLAIGESSPEKARLSFTNSIRTPLLEGIAWMVRQTTLRKNSRSEEHTSELQSLMRISYAVFCLKKKTNIHIHYTLNKLQHYINIRQLHTSTTP